MDFITASGTLTDVKATGPNKNGEDLGRYSREGSGYDTFVVFFNTVGGAQDAEAMFNKKRGAAGNMAGGSSGTVEFDKIILFRRHANVVALAARDPMSVNAPFVPETLEIVLKKF